MRQLRTLPRDPGLQQIDDWRDWFIDAHRRRLRADGHDEVTAEHLMIPITAQAHAIAERLRADYLARSGA